MKIYPDKLQVPVDKNNQPILVQIGKEFYELRLVYSDVGINDLKNLLKTRDVRLLKEVI